MTWPTATNEGAAVLQRDSSRVMGARWVMTRMKAINREEADLHGESLPRLLSCLDLHYYGSNRGLSLYPARSGINRLPQFLRNIMRKKLRNNIRLISTRFRCHRRTYSVWVE
jgi:hypothetical protein